jgi:hypothetical protein
MCRKKPSDTAFGDLTNLGISAPSIESIWLKVRSMHVNGAFQYLAVRSCCVCRYTYETRSSSHPQISQAFHAYLLCHTHVLSAVVRRLAYRSPFSIARALRLSLHHGSIDTLPHGTGHFRKVVRSRHHSRTVPHLCERWCFDWVCFDVFDCFKQFRVFLEKTLLEPPAFQIAVVLLEERGEAVCVTPLVILIRVFEAERPAELEVLPVRVTEVRCVEVPGVVFDHLVPKSRPSKEIDCYRMLEFLLRRSRSLPVGEVREVRLIGIEVILHQSVAFDSECYPTDFVLQEKHFLVHFSQDHKNWIVLILNVQGIPAITDCFEQGSSIYHVCCLAAIGTHGEDFLI